MVIAEVTEAGRGATRGPVFTPSSKPGDRGCVLSSPPGFRHAGHQAKPHAHTGGFLSRCNWKASAWSGGA